MKSSGVGEALHRAFGVQVPPIPRYALMAKNFSFDRLRWRKRFFSDPAYRDLLTRKVGRNLNASDYEHNVLQIGAMFNAPIAVAGRTDCASFHDGNLAEAVKHMKWTGQLSVREIDQGLAYEREVYQRVRRIFTMSEYLRTSFVQNFDLEPEKVVYVGGGINLERIPEPADEKPYDTREILFIGIEFTRKGGWVLLDAFRRVRERFPDARLHLVGPRELTIPSGCEAGVEFHGYLSKSDPIGKSKLEQLFQRCVLFVLPSLYEPFGIAPLEAMCHQLPCLVSDGWALKEMVTPNVNGMLTEPGSVEDLADKLITLLSDPTELSRMGAAGRLRVLERYTWARVVQRMLEAIPL